jgi:DNA-binding MarR family transcriptional regulator
MKKISTKKIVLCGELELSPGFLLWKVSSQWRWLVETELAKIGLTYQQFILLASLCRATKSSSGITQIKLAQRCGTDITMTSQVLRSLERKEFVRRHQSKDDARSKFSRVTKQGAAIIKQAIPIVETVDKQFFDALGTDLKKYIKMQQTLRKD